MQYFRQVPTKEESKYRFKQNTITYYNRAVLLGLIVHTVYSYYQGKSIFEIVLNFVFYFVFLFFVVGLIPKFIAFLVGSKIGEFTTNRDLKQLEKNNKISSFIGIGCSTGILSTQGHNQGLAFGQNIYLGLDDCCQNFVCFGGIGSGKTSRFMLPLAYKLLRKKERLGGLVFDVKGDFLDDLYKILNKERKSDIIIIGVNTSNGFNLLQDLSPELASSYLRSTFYLSCSPSDTFWIDSATELCKNSLGILQYTGDYNLHSLYNFIFDNQFQSETFKKAELLLKSTDERLYYSYKSYITQVFEPFDTKVKQSIKATVAQVLSPFQHPELIDSFCSSNENSADIYNIINDGKIFIIQLPIATWGTGAKVIYMLIKLRFFSTVQERLVNKSINQVRPVFFMCDEYQDLISASKVGMSDLTFWDKSRSAKCMGIISSQSISSFYSACGSKELTDTILQNFRQKFCFRSEDLATLQYFQTLTGQADVWRETYNQGEGVTQSSTDFIKNNRSKNSSRSQSKQLIRVLDGQTIRALSQNQALAFLSISGNACDDVINLTPYWELESIER